MPNDADVLAAYRATRWTVDVGAGPLTVRTGEPVPPGALPLPAAVVTACNPASEPRAPGENAAANEALAGRIRAAGLSFHPALAHGTGPDAGAWDEPGFLVPGIEIDDAVSLGAAFGQNAVLWIDGTGIPLLVSSRAGFAGSAPGSVL